MSKSDENENAFISLLDPPDAIARKLRRAVTDSDGEIRYAEEKPGVSNLLTIYSVLTGKTVAESEKDFAGQGYGVLKQGVTDAVVAALEPLQKRYQEVRGDKAFLESVMTENAEKAAYAARKTLSKVQRKIGLAPRKL